jgi:hypothetical protein
MGIPSDAAYYRQQAEKYRKLAKDHADAGSREIARRLNKFVAELEASADRLDEASTKSTQPLLWV